MRDIVNSDIAGVTASGVKLTLIFFSWQRSKGTFSSPTPSRQIIFRFSDDLTKSSKSSIPAITAMLSCANAAVSSGNSFLLWGFKE